jgi:hypothetical protein
VTDIICVRYFTFHCLASLFQCLIIVSCPCRLVSMQSTHGKYSPSTVILRLLFCTWRHPFEEYQLLECDTIWLVTTDILEECITSIISPFTFMMEAICSSETSVLTRAIWRYIPECGVLHRHHHENLKSCMAHHFDCTVVYNVCPCIYIGSDYILLKIEH